MAYGQYIQDQRENRRARHHPVVQPPTVVQINGVNEHLRYTAALSHYFSLLLFVKNFRKSKAFFHENTSLHISRQLWRQNTVSLMHPLRSKGSEWVSIASHRNSDLANIRGGHSKRNTDFRRQAQGGMVQQSTLPCHIETCLFQKNLLMIIHLTCIASLTSSLNRSKFVVIN